MPRTHRPAVLTARGRWLRDTILILAGSTAFVSIQAFAYLVAGPWLRAQ